MYRKPFSVFIMKLFYHKIKILVNAFQKSVKKGRFLPAVGGRGVWGAIAPQVNGGRSPPSYLYSLGQIPRAKDGTVRQQIWGKKTLL
jgi:hypothetical protein